MNLLRDDYKERFYMNNKIPKIIHYCWFGEKDMPELVVKCIESWKKILPDYEFMLWNESSFDINSTLWTKGAYTAKKYAFVADYVRLIKLYEFGGIYLDTDIEVKKSFNCLLHQNAFIGFECDNVLSAGVIGVCKGNLIIKSFLNYYNQPFKEEETIGKNISNAVMMTEYLKENYGLKLDNSEQNIAGFHVYPKTYFNPRDFWGNCDFSNNTFCIHLYMGSWLSEKEQIKLARRRNPIYLLIRKWYLRFKRLIKRNNFKI